MNRRIGIAALMIAGMAGCIHPAHANDIKVINACGLDESIADEAIAFCNDQLPFTLAYLSGPLSCDDPATCQEAIQALKTDADAALIALVRLDTADLHQSINTNRMTALINVTPLITDDPRQTTWRIERMIMRSVAFLLGITPAPDPNCVTRNYQSPEDLDTMGRNFTPPYNPVIRQRAQDLSITLKPEPPDGTRRPPAPPGE